MSLPWSEAKCSPDGEYVWKFSWGRVACDTLAENYQDGEFVVRWSGRLGVFPVWGGDAFNLKAALSDGFLDGLEIVVGFPSHAEATIEEGSYDLEGERKFRRLMRAWERKIESEAAPDSKEYLTLLDGAATLARLTG